MGLGARTNSVELIINAGKNIPGPQVDCAVGPDTRRGIKGDAGIEAPLFATVGIDGVELAVIGAHIYGARTVNGRGGVDLPA